MADSRISFSAREAALKAMKKELTVKYPHSASLFQFCRKVLDHKFGGVRVIDQDVGQILGFDPADCSHWKKGKKNIRSIHAMKSIADHLGVDEKLVVDVASGELSDWEAFYEYSGYGVFGIDRDLMEAARKDFYRRHANTWTRDKEQEFKNFFSTEEGTIDRIVQEIHERIDFNEAPLYLPEIATAYPKLQLKPFSQPIDETSDEIVVSQFSEDGTSIEFPNDGKMRPFVRFRIARAMAPFFFAQAGMNISTELGEYAEHVRGVQANIFAAKLLTPARLIRKELVNINVAKDIVSQLAEIFWVSKTFMNGRLKEILQGAPEL